MNPIHLGILLNSALYLFCVWYAGLFHDKPAAWKFAIIAMGVTYVSYCLQLTASLPDLRPAWLTSWVIASVVGWSVVFGVAAGLALLF